MFPRPHRRMARRLGRWYTHGRRLAAPSRRSEVVAFWHGNRAAVSQPVGRGVVGRALADRIRKLHSAVPQPNGRLRQLRGCGWFLSTGTFFFVGFFFRSFIFNRFLPRCRPPPAGALATTMGIDFSLPTTREAKKYVSVGGFPWATVVNFEQC